MRVTFLGASREVTGSSFLLEVAGKKVLLDCGFFQGSKFAEERNFAPFAFDPKSVDFLLICHAHLDHVGRIPKLVKEGFRGKIFSTAPTKEITKLVLEDSFKLMREDARKEDKPLLYYEEDIGASMALFETIGYRKSLEIYDGVVIEFFNAGHILGSASVKITAEGKSVLYSSDIGNFPSSLLSDPETPKLADFIIMETTYGSRIHEDMAKRREKLSSIFNSTIAKGGVLMIPTFAIERAQELLHDVVHFCEAGNCAIPTFFLDSPLGDKVTQVFEKYPEFLNKKVNAAHPEGIFGLSMVKVTSSVEQSKDIENTPNPKIIMAGSGMLNGGRILFHLQDYIEDSKNTLLIVGYQARGTLGRKLIEGDKNIRIFGRRYKVAATVTAIGSYSAHADSNQLLKWLSSVGQVKKVFLVHGEGVESLGFSKLVKEKLNLTSVIPQQGESYVL